VLTRRSSAGICFIGRKRDFGDFIQEYMPDTGVTAAAGLSGSGGAGGAGRKVAEVAAGASGREAAEVGGSFVSVEDGRVLGRHRGLAHYTSGQRARLGGAPQPW